MSDSRPATTSTVESDRGIFWDGREIPSFDITEFHVECSLDVTCCPLFVLANVDIEDFLDGFL
jgi:hypothetical protein